MTRMQFVLARGTWTEPDIERDHMFGIPADVRVASLSTADEVARETQATDGIIVTTNPFPREFIERLGPNVRIIARAGIGLDAIDLKAAEDRGIAVFHTPDYATEEVATHAVALILALNRKIVAADDLCRRDWAGWKQLGRVEPLYEQTAGVVGAGRIGRATADRLVPLMRRVLIYDPYVTDLPDRAERVGSLDALLSQSNVLTLHMPLTDETRGLIGRRELASMRKGAIVVNVSRGPLIDEGALAEALVDGHIGGAGLDVLEQEPPQNDAPILSAPNVILSPHLGWYSVASERRTRTMAIDGMLDYLAGHDPRAGRLAVNPRRSVGAN
jgi:D-3-phosphoglycerate dehydrogenase / 2-oxoglutarate reductase